MSKKIKSNSIESSNIKKVIEKSEGKNNYDKLSLVLVEPFNDSLMSRFGHVFIILSNI
jgi:hypothetical protein